MALKETWQSYNETTKQYETSHPETEVSQVVGLAAAIEAGTKNAIDKSVNIPEAPNLTPYMKKEADSDLDMQGRSIFMGYTSITSDDGFTIDANGNSINILGDGIYFNKSPLDTRENNQKLYAPQVSPTFKGTVTAPNVTVSTSLTIPGGKIWIA